MPENVGIITQARMTSTRLPGKVLKKINNKTLLEYHIGRLSQSGLKVYVATTTDHQDDPIEEFCKNHQLPFHRGSRENVLSRFYETALKYNLTTIIRATSDCPLIDGELIQSALQEHLILKNQNLYTSNVLERTYPRGLDFEIFSSDRLKEAFEKATEDFQKEHVTPFINRNADGKTEFKHILDQGDHSDWRLTVDTPEDFELIKVLIEKFQAQHLNYPQLVSILESHTDLKSLNQHIEQKKV
ncbi:MAG: cytidylyltransferase domain-containing protein [Pseudobdellovibrio sp.]